MKQFLLDFPKYKYYFAAGLLYVVLALLVIHYFPVKITNSDVPININEADGYLLKGINPYGQNYTLDLRPNPYDVSFNHIANSDVLQYPPLMILYYVPFFLMGDIRYGNLFADVIIYTLIVSYFSERSFERKFAILYLFNGLNFVANYFYGANDIIAGLFVGVSLYFLGKNKIPSAISFGASWVTKQLSLLLLPYFLWKAKNRISYLLVSIVVAAIIFIPFLPQVFTDTVLGLFYHRLPLPSYPLVFYPFLFMVVLGKLGSRRS
jgi:hypothetical protein